MGIHGRQSQETVSCDYCKQEHRVRIGDFYTCPLSISNEIPGGYYIAVSKNGEVKQTMNFENVKIFLGLKIIKI